MRCRVSSASNASAPSAALGASALLPSTSSPPPAGAACATPAQVGLPPGRDGISILLTANSSTLPGATMFSNPYDGYMFKGGVTLPSLLHASLNGYSFVVGARSPSPAPKSHFSTHDS